MPFSPQGVQDVGLHPRFNHDLTSHLIAGHGESGRLQSSLDVHSIIHNIAYKLRMGQRLIGPANNAESHVYIAMFHKSRNDRVKRTLARRQRVGMPWIKNKKSSPVLQNKAHPIYDHARSE